MAAENTTDIGKERHLVFVYGTLKEGFSNHGLLRDSIYHGKHETGAVHKMLSLGGFPGVIWNGGTSPIHGEVYEVTDATLARLDSLEGYPHFYDRRLIVTQYGAAYIYVLSDDFLQKHPIGGRNYVENGVWQ